jgi:hypothetical protein
VLLLQSGPAGVMFLSEEHARRFWAVWSQLGERSGDEDASLLYGLTAFSDVWRAAQAVGVVRDRRVCWSAVSGMLPGASHGRKVLFRWLLGLAALDEGEMEPVDLMILDEWHFLVAVQALLIRRYGLAALVEEGARNE